jgi:uncharacterized surface protein with fasciclin (FAS1) repeats
VFINTYLNNKIKKVLNIKNVYCKSNWFCNIIIHYISTDIELKMSLKLSVDSETEPIHP